MVNNGTHLKFYNVYITLKLLPKLILICRWYWELKILIHPWMFPKKDFISSISRGSSFWSIHAENVLTTEINSPKGAVAAEAKSAKHSIRRGWGIFHITILLQTSRHNLARNYTMPGLGQWPHQRIKFLSLSFGGIINEILCFTRISQAF